MKRNIKVFLSLMFLSVTLIVLFGVFVRPITDYNALGILYQPDAQDIGIMLLVGYGLRFAFLQKYAWSSLGFAYLTVPLTFLLYILLGGFWRYVFTGFTSFSLYVSTYNLSDYYQAAAASLIASSALYGVVGFFQLIIITVIATIGYSLNRHLALSPIGVTDTGGAMLIHLFGGIFSVAASVTFNPQKLLESNNVKSSYSNGWFSIFGAVLLWLFYPSFNGSNSLYYRLELANINTVLALCASTPMAIATSYYINGKIKIGDVIAGSLSGAIAVAATADFTRNPAFAFGQGINAGWFVVTAKNYLLAKIKSVALKQTISNHLIPGLLGGLFSSVLMLAFAASGYPTGDNNVYFKTFRHSFFKQAAIQFATILVTGLIGMISGLIGGFIINLSSKEQLEIDMINERNQEPVLAYNDELQWIVHH